MLLYEDTVGKGILIVIIHDPDTALEDDGAAIKTLVDKVHGAAGNFYPVQERLPLGVEAGKTGQERRVDVDHPAGIFPYDRFPEDTHIPGEHDKIRPGIPERCTSWL